MRIETSSIETGSSATISFGLTASAAAKPTRWRWPPLSSCGNFAATRAGRHEPDLAERPLDLVASPLAAGDARGGAGRCPRSIGCVTR